MCGLSEEPFATDQAEQAETQDTQPIFIFEFLNRGSSLSRTCHAVLCAWLPHSSQGGCCCTQGSMRTPGGAQLQACGQHAGRDAGPAGWRQDLAAARPHLQLQRRAREFTRRGVCELGCVRARHQLWCGKNHRGVSVVSRPQRMCLPAHTQRHRQCATSKRSTVCACVYTSSSCHVHLDWTLIHSLARKPR